MRENRQRVLFRIRLSTLVLLITAATFLSAAAALLVIRFWHIDVDGVFPFDIFILAGGLLSPIVVLFTLFCRITYAIGGRLDERFEPLLVPITWRGIAVSLLAAALIAAPLAYLFRGRINFARFTVPSRGIIVLDFARDYDMVLPIHCTLTDGGRRVLNDVTITWTNPRFPLDSSSFRVFFHRPTETVVVIDGGYADYFDTPAFGGNYCVMHRFGTDQTNPGRLDHHEADDLLREIEPSQWESIPAD